MIGFCDQCSKTNEQLICSVGNQSPLASDRYKSNYKKKTFFQKTFTHSSARYDFLFFVYFAAR